MESFDAFTEWARQVGQRLDELEKRCSRCGFGLPACNCVKRLDALELVAKRADAGVGILTDSTTVAVGRLDERLEALDNWRKLREFEAKPEPLKRETTVFLATYMGELRITAPGYHTITEVVDALFVSLHGKVKQAEVNAKPDAFKVKCEIPNCDVCAAVAAQ